jgi:DNA topoisomerase-3
MSYKLCIAEKPSVGKSIAAVVGANVSRDGFCEGNGYIVTWAVGHLIELAEPDAYGYIAKSQVYDEDNRERAYNELPILPKENEWKLVVKKETEKQFNIVKELMHRDDVSCLIDCGDTGAEGHYLQWIIREKAGFNKPLYRFCATSMTNEAIREAMANLKDEAYYKKHFYPMIRGEYCKHKADWILGMSMSRAESLKYHAGITVGRVQSPTLGFIVFRYLENMNFKKKNYYTLSAKVNTSEGNPFSVSLNKDGEGVFAAHDKDSEGRIINQKAAQDKANEIRNGRTGIVSELTIDKKAKNRPQLYDITELQRDANRKYGYTAAVTLATAQALYETQKVLSYPRTDSRYITEDIVPYLKSRVQAIAKISKYAVIANSLLNTGFNIDKKLVDNSKVTDHHALIPTEAIDGFDPDTLKPNDAQKKEGVTEESLKNIFDLVVTRLLVSLSAAYLYEQTNVTVQFVNGVSMSASGNKPISRGWRAAQLELSGKILTDGDEETEDAQIFPNIKKGDTVTVQDCMINAKETTPPQLYTEATLLTAMENAGARIENGAILKGKGIGTQATRAGIIKGLFDTKAVETLTKGKTNYIVPTEKGISIISILPQELYSPAITADWETKISHIVEGTYTEQEFMRDFTGFITAEVQKTKDSEVQNVRFIKERETFGVCPWCGGNIYIYEDKKPKNGEKPYKRYYCSSKECIFSIKDTNAIFTVRTGRKIKENEIKKLIASGHLLATCKTKSGDKSYKADFSLTRNQYKDKDGNMRDGCSLTFEFVKPSTKRNAKPAKVDLDKIFSDT